jgi:hypothetical protein
MIGICTTITSLPSALFWGSISVSGIIVGALIGIFAPLTLAPLRLPWQWPLGYCWPRLPWN